eukprot:s5844_g3.t1
MAGPAGWSVMKDDTGPCDLGVSIAIENFAICRAGRADTDATINDNLWTSQHEVLATLEKVPCNASGAPWLLAGSWWIWPSCRTPEIDPQGQRNAVGIEQAKSERKLALVEMDTGGGCFLKQVVDVYLFRVPNEGSCPDVPDIGSLSLAKGEVDNVMYIEIDRLEEIWHASPPNPEFVVPPGEDYRSRLFFNARQRHKKYCQQLAEAEF